MSVNFLATRDGQAITANGTTQLSGDALNAEDALVDNRGGVDFAIKFCFAGDSVAYGTGIRVPAGAVMAFSKARATHIAIAALSGLPNAVVHLGVGS